MQHRYSMQLSVVAAGHPACYSPHAGEPKPNFRLLRLHRGYLKPMLACTHQEQLLTAFDQWHLALGARCSGYCRYQSLAYDRPIL